MRVLVCEDDRHIRGALCEILRQEGYEVIEANDGVEALESYFRFQPDFICLDIMLPGKNGYDVCRTVRESASTPILFLSAKSEEIDRVLALELGGDDYVVKPFGVREVVSRIRAITRRCFEFRPPQLASFQFGDWHVSPQELTARRAGQTVDLSLRDSEMLTLLFRERGRVVTRDTLFDRCWGLQHVPNSRTLDQHISQLRKKLEQASQTQWPIETVHGVGYRYPFGE